MEPVLNSSLKIKTCEMHCGGEPLRIVEQGFPEVRGDTLLEKRRYLMSTLDHYRTFLMWEPRGHRDMYGCLVLPAVHPEADFSVIFMHNEGYSTMCGHATICLGRYIVEKLWRVEQEPDEVGEIPVTIECPCGLVRVFVKRSPDPIDNGAVRFRSVAAFVYKTNLKFDIPGIGSLTLDIAFGGAYYAILPSEQCGVEFGTTSIWDIIKTCMLIKKYLMQNVPIVHEGASDLGFLYGVILTDDSQLMGAEKQTTNITIFADGEVDRCPTGSGVTARMALMYFKKTVTFNETVKFLSGVNGSVFTGKVVDATPDAIQDQAVVVEVAGKAHFTGANEFTLEEDDPHLPGFMVS